MGAPEGDEHIQDGGDGAVRSGGIARGNARLRPQLKWLRAPLLQAAKTAAAAALSWFVAADVIGNNLPVFAPLAAVLTVQVTVWDSVSRGVQRVLGVIVGVLVAFGLARLMGVHIWSVALVVFLSWIAGQLLRLGTQGAVQVPVTALLVLVLGTTTSGYAWDRVVDTFIGAGIGVAISLIAFPRAHLPEAQSEVRGLARQLATLLHEIATGLRRPDGGSSARLADARRLSEEAERTATTTHNSVAATRWNPAGYRDRPAAEELEMGLKTLNTVERATRGIARALADAPADFCLPPDVAGMLGDLLDEVANDLESWATQVTSGVPGVDPGVRQATRPEVAAQSRPDIAARYHDVVQAARSPAIKPETAAIVDAIAIDANRIGEELWAEPDPGSATDRLHWRSLLNP
jgi:uncharacterized membrane protein YgaE (UPF0421/DUF939 family)